MSTPTTDRSTKASDTELNHALALRSAGMIEVLRVTRLVNKAADMLSFTGVPTSSTGSVRGLEVSFVEGEAQAPGFDPVTGLLRLFYPLRERNAVEQLLTSKRQRFCYFWHSRDGEQRHAWLLSSP